VKSTKAKTKLNKKQYSKGECDEKPEKKQNTDRRVVRAC